MINEYYMYVQFTESLVSTDFWAHSRKTTLHNGHMMPHNAVSITDVITKCYVPICSLKSLLMSDFGPILKSKFIIMSAIQVTNN